HCDPEEYDNYNSNNDESSFDKVHNSSETFENENVLNNDQEDDNLTGFSSGTKLQPVPDLIRNPSICDSTDESIEEKFKLLDEDIKNKIKNIVIKHLSNEIFAKLYST